MPTPQEAAAILRDALASGFDPSKLRGLRETRLREMERNKEFEDDAIDESQFNSRITKQPLAPTFRTGATRSDISSLQDDLDDDPYTGVAERKRIGGIQTALDTAATTNRQEVGDAANTSATRNAFAKFMDQRESKRGGYAADITQTGKDALDAASARRVDENRARVRPAATGAGANAGAYSSERAGRALQSVDELMGKVGNLTSGLGSLTRIVPGSPARNFSAELETLKSNLAFNELAEMRAASKTGGALGAVSDREMSLLQSTMGALDAGQSPENLRGQLQKVKASIERWEAAKAGGGTPDTPDDQDDDIPIGTTRTYPNGAIGVWDGSGWERQ